MGAGQRPALRNGGRPGGGGGCQPVAGQRRLSSLFARSELVLAAVAVTMGVIALAAALGPARRALSLDPLQALRQQ